MGRPFFCLVSRSHFWRLNLPRRLGAVPGTRESERTPHELTETGHHRGLRVPSPRARDPPPQLAQGRRAPCKHWWTEDCAQAATEFRRSFKLDPQSTATRSNRKAFRAVVKRAKANHWREQIENAFTDQDIFEVVGWHNRNSQLQPPPLLVDGVEAPILEPEAKARALRGALLERNSEEDAIAEPWSIPVVPRNYMP